MIDLVESKKECLPKSAGGNVEVGVTNSDHSKFMVQTDGSKDIICFSGMNRRVSQWPRGGLAVCFKNKKVHDHFDGILKEC